jgi:hypothetical protein
MHPRYLRFAGDNGSKDVVRVTLDALWAYASGVGRLPTLAPIREMHGHVVANQGAHGQDARGALEALIEAVRCAARPDAHHALTAAEIALDGILLHVHLHASTNDERHESDWEDQAMLHPLVTKECNRQLADAALLATIDAHGDRGVQEALRVAARGEAQPT